MYTDAASAASGVRPTNSGRAANTEVEALKFSGSAYFSFSGFHRLSSSCSTVRWVLGYSPACLNNLELINNRDRVILIPQPLQIAMKSFGDFGCSPEPSQRK